MSSRLLSCLLLLVIVAAWKLPVSSGGQEVKSPIENRWEYRVLKLDGNQCVMENVLSEHLNRLGQEGWELVSHVSHERTLTAFPTDAEGTLLITPAATGPGREHTPMTADSFEGTMHMTMAQAQPQTQPGPCLLILKRQSRPAPSKPS
ncbi:MAG: hypothetical protein ACHP79_02350 [Terriglobales bacterium]